MKKLLLASVLAIASFPNYALAGQGIEDGLPCHDFTGAEYDQCAKRATYCKRDCKFDKDFSETEQQRACFNTCLADDRGMELGTEPKPPARVTVTPPYQGPPPIGWVYGPYTQCANPPQCSMGVVNVDASGLNVRVTPNGPPVMSLVNGVPIIPLQKQGDWLLVAPACDSHADMGVVMERWCPTQQMLGVFLRKQQ